MSYGDSGAARRRKKYEREEAVAVPGAPDEGAWAKDFERAGKPDLNNPDTDLAYVRKLQLICLRQAAITPFPTPAQERCWRRIREMAAVAGMTSSKASLEAKVKKLQTMVAQYQQAGSAIVEVRGDSIIKPHTARGQGRPGPRILPPEPKDPDQR